jgi:hypothetical protein
LYPHNFIYCRSNRYRKLWIIFQNPYPIIHPRC